MYLRTYLFPESLLGPPLRGHDALKLPQHEAVVLLFLSPAPLLQLEGLLELCVCVL